MRDRLRLAILTADRSAVQEILNSDLWSDKELDVPDQNGRTPILNAAFAYQLDICLDFLDAGASVTVVEKESGNTILHYLSKASEPSSEELLLVLKTILHGALAKGCNVNQQDRDGLTPLHYAARICNHSVVYILVQHGAFVNVVSATGETALHYCVTGKSPGWIDTAKRLIDSGADPNCLDDAQRSPFSIIQKQPSSEVSELLEKMSKVTLQDIQETPREQAVMTQGNDVQKKVRKVVAVGELAKQKADGGDSPEYSSGHGSRKPSALDLTLIGQCVNNNINVEYGKSGVNQREILVNGLYHCYQNLFFQHSHYIFVAKLVGIGCRIVCVLRLLDVNNMYRVLVVNQYGFHQTWIEQAAIVGEENVNQPSPRDMEKRFLDYFRENWSSPQIDWSLLDSRVGTHANFASLVNQQNDKSTKAEVIWHAVSSTKSDLPCLLLGLECRLGLGKRVTVGVVYMKGSQGEELAFKNKESPNFLSFLDILATKVPLKDWKAFDGFLSVSEVDSIYYASWRGFEIVFHVASQLNSESQRQRLGNDKCMIYYVEGEGAVSPEFRGNVNSVALVVKCLEAVEALEYDRAHMNQWGCPAELFGSVAEANPLAWRIGCFFRKRITHYSPFITTR